MLIYRQLVCSTTDCPCQKGPQSPEYVLQLCPLYSSAPSSEKQNRTSVLRVGPTVLSPLQRSTNTAVAPRNNTATTAVGQHGGPCEDHNLHPNHRTDHLRQKHARIQQNCLQLQTLHPSGKPQTDAPSHPLTQNKESLQLT